MRTLTPTLLEAQKSNSLKPHYRIFLTRSGQNYEFDVNRIKQIEHKDYPYSQTAEVTLSNADNGLTNIDLKGYQATISYGLTTSEGLELVATDPLTVIAQQFDSAPGQLTCKLIMQGIPDNLADDKASMAYQPDETSTETVRDLVTAILAATHPCYNHCKAYTVIWDASVFDDSLQNYQPKANFRIYTGQSRLTSVKILLSFTNCMMKYTNGAIHIGLINQDSPDYIYSLSPGQHTFLAKAYRKRLVIPNRIVVKSNPDEDLDQYYGEATHASYSILPKTAFHLAELESNEQATQLAQAMINKAALETDGGSGIVPLNLGAEIFDYVQITDSRSGDTVTGNVGYIHRRVGEGGKWEMTFGFGNWFPSKGLLQKLETETSIGNLIDRLSVKDLYVEKIHAKQLDVAWVDPEGNIDLSMIGDNLDSLPDGEVYARVKAIHLDGEGGLKLDELVTYKPGYDPSTKMPGNATLDDIPNGMIYSRVLSTHIDAGRIKLTSDTVVAGKWYDYSGVSIDALNGIILYGSNTAFRTRATIDGLDQCFMDSTGAICAGAGYVKLDREGIKINSVGGTGLLRLQYGEHTGSLYEGSAGNLVIMSTGGVRIDPLGNIEIGRSMIPTRSVNLGSPGAHWDTLYANNVIGYGAITAPIISASNQLTAGQISATTISVQAVYCNNVGTPLQKAIVYCDGLSACPMPARDNALDVIRSMKDPVVTDKGHFGAGYKYFEVEDFPEEMKADFEWTDEKGNKQIKRDIEIIRTVGMQMQAIRELTRELDQIKTILGGKIEY